MVGPGHCPMISKYDPPLSKAVGPVDLSFLVVKKFYFDKKDSSELNKTVLNTVKHVLSSHSKRQNKDCNNKW